MLSKALRTSFSVLLFQVLLSAPASAAIINWQYAGTVLSNYSLYGGVSAGDPISLTVTVDTTAVDFNRMEGSGGPAGCGLYAVPTVTVAIGGQRYQSSSSSMIVNPTTGDGNCGFGPSDDGYVLVGSAVSDVTGSLPWRIYAEIRDVPVSASIPEIAPLGQGVFLDLASGFLPPTGAPVSMTAYLTSSRTEAASEAVPEPLTLSLALVGLASFGAREVVRRRAARLAQRAPGSGPAPTIHGD